MRYGASRQQSNVVSPLRAFHRLFRRRLRAWAHGLGMPTQVAIAYVVAHALWLVLTPRDTASRELIGNLFFAPVGAAMAVMAWASARDRRLDVPTRRGWSLLALAFLLLGISTNVWSIDDLVFGATRKLQWINDLSAILFVLCFLAALLAFPQERRTRAERVKALLDGATVFIGAATLLWHFMISPRYDSAVGWSWPVISSLVSPVGNVFLLIAASGILSRTPRGSTAVALRYVAVGQLVLILADIVHTPLYIANSYRAGHPVDLLWMLGDAIIFAGAAYQRRHDADHQPTSALAQRRYARLPYLFVAAGFLPLLALSVHWSAGDRLILYATVVLSALVIVRQYVVLRENDRLARERQMQEARFRSLVQHASDAVTVVSADGTIHYQSASVERLLGYLATQHVGEPYVRLVHPDDAAVFQQCLDDARTPGMHGRTARWRVRHRNGSWIQFETIATDLVHDAAVRGIVLNSRDVGERLALEAQLLQAQKLEAIGRLAGGIAHDFNNLLTAIRMTAASAVEQLPAGSSIADELREIEQSVDRGSSLTRQLLAFSRKQILQFALVDVARVVLGIEPMLRRLVTKGVTLEVEAPLQQARVLADAGQIEQVVMNLALNARDAMPDHGTLRIAVSTTTVDVPTARAHPGLLPRDYVVVTVRDTGMGMTPEVQSHLFEPFFTTKEIGRGTGLGLSTVYAIVQQSGGAVGVRSTVGEGTTFTVYLPRALDESPTLRPPSEPGAASGGRETVLVVDDEESVRIAVRRILQKLGYAVLEASSGTEALGKLSADAGRIDLLLTDMVMPEVGGRELIERAATLYPDLGIVCMSGYTEDGALRSGLLASEHAFIAKPFTVAELAATVRRVLDTGSEDAMSGSTAGGAA